MANRDTVKSNIITKNVPSVTNAILTDMLNGELADNVKFREDVGATQSSGVSAITVNFEGKDRVDLTRTGGSLNITVAGMGDGELKYLLITKTAGQAITWTNVTDVTPILDNVNTLGIVLYEIVRKGSYYFARAWVDTVKQATDSVIGALAIASVAEHNALSVLTKAVVPGRLPIGLTAQKGLMRFATQAEAEAFTDNDSAITPLQFLNALNNVMSANVMNLTGKAGNITVADYKAYKVGRLITGFIRARSSVANTNLQVGTLGGWIPTSGGNWHFIGVAEIVATNPNAVGYITQGSNIFLYFERINEDFTFNFVVPVSQLSQ